MNGQDPAFPFTSDDEDIGNCTGMDIRTYLAGQLMPHLLKNLFPFDAAKAAVLCADELIDALNRSE